MLTHLKALHTRWTRLPPAEEMSRSNRRWFLVFAAVGAALAFVVLADEARTNLWSLVTFDPATGRYGLLALGVLVYFGQWWWRTLRRKESIATPLPRDFLRALRE
jgi:hypothetical protein